MRLRSWDFDNRRMLVDFPHSKRARGRVADVVILVYGLGMDPSKYCDRFPRLHHCLLFSVYSSLYSLSLGFDDALVFYPQGTNGLLLLHPLCD